MIKTMVRLFSAVTLAFIISGCAQFRGPGELETSEYQTPSQYPQAPDVEVPHRNQVDNKAFVIDWPVTEPVRISQAFKTSKNPSHRGIDLTGPRGAPILAAHDGLVIYAGRAYRGYGRMIIIEFNNEWASLYAHLNSIKVKQGQMVTRGQTIGTMGRSGRATGVHLHFELMHHKLPIDPLKYLRVNELTMFENGLYFPKIVPNFVSLNTD